MEQAIKLLIENGYQVNGTTVTAPECDSPLDAISIQGQLEDLGYRLEYIGDKLKLIEIEI